MVNRNVVNHNDPSPLGFCVTAHSKGLSTLYKPFRMSTYKRVLELRILKDLQDFLSDAPLCLFANAHAARAIGAKQIGCGKREASARRSKVRRYVTTNTEKDSTEMPACLVDS